MWLMMNDSFISIVSKAPAKDGELLVRARRPGDIEKVFGRKTKVTRATDADYLFRAIVAKEDVTRAIQNEVMRIDYSNFKDSVVDDELHDAYLKVWTAMAATQNPRPYSEMFRHMPETVKPRPLTNEAISNVLPTTASIIERHVGPIVKTKTKKKGK